jgi:hypothetical protein
VRYNSSMKKFPTICCVAALSLTLIRAGESPHVPQFEDRPVAVRVSASMGAGPSGSIGAIEILVSDSLDSWDHNVRVELLPS